MATVGYIPTPVVSTTPTLITGVLRGNLLDNQRDVMWQIKEAWKAKGWTVVQSYNANGSIPAAGVDSWASYADLKGTGGGGVGNSWIVLGNATNTMQVCFQIIVSGGWLEVQRTMSPAGGFAGGTTGARPTAAGEILDSTAGYLLGTGPSGNIQFYAIVWVASDFSYTRVASLYGGMVRQFWQFDQLKATPNGWTNNFLEGVFSWGNTDYTITGNRASATLYQTILGSGGTFKSVLTPGPDTVTSVEATLDSSLGGNVPNVNSVANGYSSQYIWVEPMGVSKRSGAASVNGFWGYVRDQWWTVPSVFADGDTMGDAYQFIILGQMVLQWGLGPVGALLGASSTNYPTARFYGRDGAGSVCTCGPDTCNTPTTPLITLRNGAKELADKVNDASVSDITWNVWINQGIESLWSLVATAFSDQFFKTFDFTLTGGAGGNILDVSTVPTVLANDFRRVRMVEWMPDTAARQKLRAFNWNEKDSRIGSFGGSPWSNDRRYRLMGQKLYVEPYEQAAGSYRLYYVPGPSMKLALTCDAIDPAVNEWAEFPMIFAAMKALGKEESDDSQLARRLMELKAEILDAASSRNDGDADTIADVEGGGGYFG